MRKDGGYAMLAAVAGAAAFAFIAFETLASYRGVIASARGQVENAQLRAAADAGLAAALYGLSLADEQKRWTIDGRVRTMQFADMALTIVVEDEHGKIPINRLNEDEIRQMFVVAGIKGPRLDQLVDSVQDWTDEDDDPRPHGAEAPDYAAEGIKPRNGDFETIGELALVKGMDSALYAKLAPALTVFFGETGAFSVEDAQPLALAVMSDTKISAPSVIERQRELAGERTALGGPTPPNIAGRPLTIRVSVRNRTGGTYEHASIVEFTGSSAQPYWVRYFE